MNAVNLIPADARKRRVTPSTSRPTMALIAGLMVVLIAAILYVSAVNKVSTRRNQLAQVTASAERWRVVAASYQQYMQAAQQRTQELTAVRQLAVGRYPWEALLGQLSRLLPADAALTSLQATTATAGGTSSTPSPSTATTPGAASSAATATTPVPAVQLSGCAASQPAVAQTMVALHRIQNVSAVTLSSATDSTSGSSSGSAGGSGQNGGCPFAVQFQLSLAFTAPVAAPAAPASAGSGTIAPATPAQSTSGGTATAAAATNSTGVHAQ